MERTAAIVGFMNLQKVSRRWHRWLPVASIALLAGCATGLKLIPPAQLNEMAIAQFQQMKQEMAVSNDRTYFNQVNRVGGRVAAVVDDQIEGAAWEFVVFEDESVNAFAMPGGKVGVNTGLLKLVESDDELAAVLGHEVCHILFEHGNQRISADLLRQMGGAVLESTTGQMEGQTRAMVLAAYGLGTQVGVMLPFGRAHEYEADAQGLIVAAKAGYDPRAAITFWEKMMAQSGGGQPPEFLSTHPNQGNRIERLQELMPEALAIYEQNR